MATRKRNPLSLLGSAIVGFADSISFARQAAEIFSTPEDVFRARGTTRDAVFRAAAKRL